MYCCKHYSSNVTNCKNKSVTDYCILALWYVTKLYNIHSAGTGNVTGIRTQSICHTSVPTYKTKKKHSDHLHRPDIISVKPQHIKLLFRLTMSLSSACCRNIPS